MTKQGLDKFITDKYDMLYSIASGLNTKNCRNFDPSILISEAYEHCHGIIKQIIDEDTLQRYLIAKISMECRYSNSRTNLRERILENPNEFVDKDEPINDIQNLYKKIDAYYNTGDPIDVIFFQAYFEQGHSSIRKLCKYFGISHPIVMSKLKRIKDEINKIEINEEI
jgi:hypothetical protein